MNYRKNVGSMRIEWNVNVLGEPTTKRASVVKVKTYHTIRC